MINYKNPSSRIIAGMIAIVYTLLSGCSSMSPIQAAKLSKSEFEGAVYPGETKVISNNPGIEEFRVFHHAATGFVSVQSVRQSAEKRAADFCRQSDKEFNVFRETTSKPPHIFGNFPRIELIFGCIEKGFPAITTSTDEQKYRKIASLKALLDSGAVTKEEFEHEKTKILSQP